MLFVVGRLMLSLRQRTHTKIVIHKHTNLFSRNFFLCDFVVFFYDFLKNRLGSNKKTLKKFKFLRLESNVSKETNKNLKHFELKQKGTKWNLVKHKN